MTEVRKYGALKELKRRQELATSVVDSGDHLEDDMDDMVEERLEPEILIP